MDFMDIDMVVDVPDTPDRLAAHKNNGNSAKMENNSSMTSFPVIKSNFEERSRNRAREIGKPVIDNGHRRLFSRPENLNNSVSVSANTSSFKNSLPSLDKNSRPERKHNGLNEVSGKGKALCISQSKKERGIVDEQNGHVRVLEKVVPTGASGDSRVLTSRKGLLSGNGFSSLHGSSDSPRTSDSPHKFIEKAEDIHKSKLSLDRGKGVDFGVDAQNRTKGTASAFLQHSMSPRVTGQKRLVRHGYISPVNIEKAKQVMENHSTGAQEKVEQNDTEITGSVGAPRTVDIKELIAEAKDAHRFKGKGVLRETSSSKEPNARSMDLPKRSQVPLKHETAGSGADESNCYEGLLQGWRTTRNRMTEVEKPLPEEELHIYGEKDALRLANQKHNINRVVRRDNRNENSSRDVNDHSFDPNLISRTLSSWEPRHRVSTLTKRQRQASTTRNLGECSTSTFDESGIVMLSPSRDSSSLESTRNKSLHGVGASSSVIELDESPEVRNNSSIRSQGSNEDKVIRAIQMEEDEILARELQEQLYSEEPAVGTNEIDELVALALQQDMRSRRVLPADSRDVYNPGGSSASNINHRPSNRRSVQPRSSIATRMTQFRGRFPGQSRTISSSTRESLFPPGMDLDMRMQILETLEAFSDMDIPGGLLNAAREFNENDYELLLALDENNHQHGGATAAQINGLPESKVQTDTLEDCAVCLETPTIGETIRHLPCLHRFHKDCIDQWLKRKKSCPVCKSSITPS